MWCGYPQEYLVSLHKRYLSFLIPNSRYFTDRQAWVGGFYELSLQIRPHSDEKLFEALKTLWQHPALEGCYLKRDIEPVNQKRMAPSLPLESPERLYGLATLHSEERITCGSVILPDHLGSDWLDFYVPLGSLSTVYEVAAYPFDMDEVSSDTWQTPIDTWLWSIGSFIFQRAPFQLGLIGFEIFADISAEHIEENGIPTQRPIGYLWPVDGQLQYYPRNSKF